jgi:protein subunit release factor A
MALYFFDLVGIDEDDMGWEFKSESEARNAAVGYLGEYLKDYPEYANQGHWRVNVLDNKHNLLFHVVVATVDARRMQSPVPDEAKDAR